ncbi:conserved hypothetical protein [Beutenbergia cavernae DSM 12333]|uniref:ThuA-like domain-containing protein n=1 Tax=Beutenbergia cavernae (strain ATCC BAA-8 / DSM 12333 / CCUG 43141 / JCM 11478 / NBRC 16432 / NCIMB 13614 / HKI 0122) TaxID=471853 RepID=C5C1D8_BEUC1|nr:conserved hypothetical protein [Beutenbergia cavernae DSM 12333]
MGIVVLAGTGRYADPWHDFPGTSEAIAGVLRKEGHAVEVRPTEPDAFDLAGADLLVVNAGGGLHEDTGGTEWAAAHAALTTTLSIGMPVLGVHAAANTFTDVPAWHARLGGRWVVGTSMHPERGESRFDVVMPPHPIVAGLHTLHVADDERYSRLETDPFVVPLLDHAHDGLRHVCAWVHDGAHGRAVYDGLGHGATSYDSPDRRELLLREVRWLLGA